jgi:DNA-binding NarL/FixJ family response regulator
MEKRYNITYIPEGEPLFTTSQETDVWEMIRDGLSVNEIIHKIKKW